MIDVQVTMVPKELYYHEVAYVRGLEKANAELVAALKKPAPQELRQRIWDMLEGNAVAGNLRPGHIRGNGVPDLIWEWITTALAAAGQKPT